MHRIFLEQLLRQARQRGLKQDRFLARKGDVRPWHADLPHGGSRITEDVTRRSLALHFVPRSVKPNFEKVIGGNYHEPARPDGHTFASRHYRMADIDEQAGPACCTRECAAALRHAAGNGAIGRRAARENLATSGTSAVALADR